LAKTGSGDAIVLVVDDDPVIRALVRAALEKLNLDEVLLAEDGEDARAVLEARDVDLVVTDLLMPRMDGIELIRWARRAGLTPEWIILSALETFDVAVEAVQLGAFDFLSKPPRLEELEVAVRNALEQRRLIRDRERLFSELEETTRQLAANLRKLEEKSELLRRDLERAEVIQRALLPRDPPALAGWCVSALYRPGRYVGGDLYQVVPVGSQHLALLVADATGHGVTSAMMSVLFHRRLRLTDSGGATLGPGAALERVNRTLFDDGAGAGVFLTAALAVLHLETGELTLAGAGHPPAILRRASGEVHRIERTGPALGLVQHATYAEQRTRLERGDRLLLFTDGLFQGAGGEGALDRFGDLLGAEHATGLALLQDLVERQAEDAPPRGDGQDRDDVTAVLLEAGPGRSEFENRAGQGRVERRPPRSNGTQVLWYGESGGLCVLEVRGRGTWTEADAFHETAIGILSAGRLLEVVLRRCEYLDSTFLGTLHELVSHAEGGGDASLRLVDVPRAIRHEFEELGMERVLGAIRTGSAGASVEMKPLDGRVGGSASHARVLRAHEALASLSARNREKFLTVVETLRQQLRDD